MARGARLLIRFTGPELWWLLNVARWAAAHSRRIGARALGAGLHSVAAAGVAVVVLWCWRRRREELRAARSEMTTVGAA